MYSTPHQYHRQLGSSLIESLVALAITSTFSLVVIKLQVNLLRHTNYVYQQELAVQTQISLAESLKSCLGNRTCQQFEIARWSKTQLVGESELEQQQADIHTVLSKVYVHKNKTSILQFSHV